MTTTTAAFDGQSKPNHMTMIGATPTIGSAETRLPSGSRPRCRNGTRSIRMATRKPGAAADDDSRRRRRAASGGNRRASVGKEPAKRWAMAEAAAGSPAARRGRAPPSPRGTAASRRRSTGTARLPSVAPRAALGRRRDDGVDHAPGARARPRSRGGPGKAQASCAWRRERDERVAAEHGPTSAVSSDQDARLDAAGSAAIAPRREDEAAPAAMLSRRRISAQPEIKSEIQRAPRRRAAERSQQRTAAHRSAWRARPRPRRWRAAARGSRAASSRVAHALATRARSIMPDEPDQHAAQTAAANSAAQIWIVCP